MNSPYDTAISLIGFWWACIESERGLSDEPPITDDQVILHYSGCGASAMVTAGHIRALVAGPTPSGAGGEMGKAVQQTRGPESNDPCLSGKTTATPVDAGGVVVPRKLSNLAIAGVAVKHFGNPIPPAAYAFARELLDAPQQSAQDKDHD